MNRFTKRLLLVFSCVVVVGLLTILGISLKVGWALTHPEKSHVAVAAGLQQSEYQNVAFPSRRGDVSLKGWFLPSGTSNKTIIFAHGYGMNRLQEDVPALEIAMALRSNGYNILMFDFRGCGESEGSLTTVGQFEKEDMIGAVDYVKGMGKPGEHVGAIGFSMGAVATLLAASEDSRIEAIVADAAFADLEKYLSENLPVWSDLPAFPFTPAILNIMPVVLGLDPSEVSPVSVVQKIRAPILYIHGDRDEKTPASNTEQLYAKAPSGKRLWIVPDTARHVGSYKSNPNEYLEKVIEFFKNMK